MKTQKEIQNQPKNTNRKKLQAGQHYVPPYVIPPNTQHSQTLESSQTSDQVGITYLAHLIEETIETEPERQNSELEFTRVFGQGEIPREATESKSTIPGLTPENFDQLLQKAYDKVNSTQFTRFIWKKVQKHEKANQEFKTNLEMYSWVRSNLRYKVLYKQSINSRLASAGKKSCALCMRERMCIYMAKNDPNVEKRSKLVNKKSELKVRCTCTAKFLRLTLERKVGC